MKVHGVLETAIYVDDLQVAIDFYQRLFEFEIMAEDQRFCAMNADLQTGRDAHRRPSGRGRDTTARRGRPRAFCLRDRAG